MRLTSTKILRISIILVLVIFNAFMLLNYDRLPKELPTHWDINGNIDGYSSKQSALLFAAAFTNGLAAFLLILPSIDPLKKNYKSFQVYYDSFILIITGFMALIFSVPILIELGYEIEMERVLPLGIGILFVYTGLILPKIKKNWFMGIRTPWTMSSDRVWKKTHELGGKLFLISGFLTLLGAVFPDYFFALIMVPIVTSTLILILYSYLEYRKE